MRWTSPSRSAVPCTVHCPATRSNQPHVGMWGNLPASPSQVSPPVRLRPQQFEKTASIFFFPRTRTRCAHGRSPARASNRRHVCTAGCPPNPITRPLAPQAGGPRATAHHVGCRAPGPNRPRPDKESPPHDPASKPPRPHLSARAQAAASGHAAGPPAPLAPLPPPPRDTRLRATI